MGSWIWYGLGAANENLPGFVVLVSTGKSGQQQPIAARQWHSGFLPSRFQGVQLRAQGDPVLYLSNPAGVTPTRQQDVVTAINQLNQLESSLVDDPEIATRISQYEMAFRMQTSVPDLTDISKESDATLEMYGPDVKKPGSFAYNCLLARRMAERGVRFVQLYSGDTNGWDAHEDVDSNHSRMCRRTDRPVAGLLHPVQHHDR